MCKLKNWSISYYNEKVRKEVFAMAAGIVNGHPND